MKMCLAVPVLIRSIDGSNAVVDLGGVSRTISLTLTPEANVGDYVLIHAGYAIGVLDEAEAKETLDLLNQMVTLDEKGQPSKESDST
jgi:hydrogenase expression/formation protein HypC